MIRKASHAVSMAGTLIAVALGLAAPPQGAAQVAGLADKTSTTGPKSAEFNALKSCESHDRRKDAGNE